jgi:glycosyltransferase involved in cell wall biosynthesis
MNSKINRIAYLAPELPSLSATFVTNEIWALEGKGMKIYPFSVHKPGHKAHGEKAEELANRTYTLYDHSFLTAITSFLKLFLKNPGRILKAKMMMLSDIWKVGLFSIQSMKLFYQFVRGSDLALNLMNQNVQHLHIHFAHVPTQIGMYAAIMADIPFTFMVHANDIFERPLLIREKVARAHRTASISQFNIDLMEKKGADLNRIEIVRCGVDANQYGTMNASVRQDDVFLIGTIGRLVEKKGIDTLIEAAKWLKETEIKFRVEIAGDGPLLEELKSLSKKLDLDDKIAFLGSLPHEKVMTWMKQLDVFVLAAKKDRNGDMDGIPVVLMEAMMLGIPVISTQLSGIPELILHENTGLIGKPGSSTDLTNNLMRIMESEVLVQKLTQNATHRIINEFDRSLNADRLIAMINRAT